MLDILPKFSYTRRKDTADIESYEQEKYIAAQGFREPE
jgi:hypothetical protein